MTAPTLLDRPMSNATGSRDEAAQQTRTAPVGLSAAGWSRLRGTVTTATFIVATLVGVTVGIRAVDVSPVAPPVAISQPASQPAATPPDPAVIQPTAPVAVQPTAPVDNGGGRQPGIGRGPGRGGGGVNGGRR